MATDPYSYNQYAPKALKPKRRSEESSFEFPLGAAVKSTLNTTGLGRMANALSYRTASQNSRDRTDPLVDDAMARSTAINDEAARTGTLVRRAMADSAARNKPVAAEEDAADATPRFTPTDIKPMNNPAVSIQRRGGVIADESAGPAARQYSKGANEFEGERKQRLSDVDSAMFDLSMRGGGLNMRSKRELFGQLVGEKNKLTGKAMDSDDARALQAQRINEDAAQAAEQLGEARSRRRDAMSTFNSELDFKVDSENAGNELKRRGLGLDGRRLDLTQRELEREEFKLNEDLKPKAPTAKELAEIRKMNTETAGLDAKYKREAEGWDDDSTARASKYDDGRIKERMERDGATRETATYEELVSGLRAGEDPNSRPLRGMQRQLLDATRDAINKPGVGTWLNSLFAGDAYTPGSRGEVSELNDFDDIQLERPMTALRLLTPKNVEATVERDGKKVTQYLTDEQAARIQEMQRLERMSRRSQP